MKLERDPSLASLTGDPVVNQARKRFRRVSEWESNWRTKFINDIRFRHGDSENGYQWPNAIRQARDVDNRPCLTMNVVRQHNLMITNRARLNKSSIKFVGMGNGATQESANVFRDLARHIEYISNAQSAYTLARNFQVDGGFGAWRVVTDYAPGSADEQEIYIRPILDPLSVYMDYNIQQFSGEDSSYAFIFDDMPEDEFIEAYPQYENQMGHSPLGIGSTQDDWLSRDQTRICEYFRKVKKPDTLVSFVYRGERRTIKRSLLHQEHLIILDDPLTRTREVFDDVVEWYLIAGEQVIDKTIWPGQYIPIIRCVGEETVINGILDRKGHTRMMKDAQRMYNYNASAQVEFTALQGKTPWVAPIDAIDEYETLWNTANLANHSVLPFKHVDDQGNPIPPPQRQEPPTASPAYQQGMETAFNQMMMTSGQWQNQMGMMGNERTGAAIKERKDAGDIATYHFEDNYAEALKYTAKILIDVIPKIYDTKRVKQIMAEDGVDYELEINPASRQAYLQERNHQGQVVKHIFNPQIGQYDIAPDVGPAYGSKRAETAEVLGNIIAQAPALTGIVGDLFVGSLDFDKAQEAAIRLKRMVPPQALGQGPSPQEQQLQQQNQTLQAELAKLLEQNAKEKLKLAGKAEMRDIDAYDAETKRIAALQKMLPMDPEGLKKLISQLVEEAMHTSLGTVLEANQESLKDATGESPAEPPTPSVPQGNPPMPGARQAGDGEWYILDPTRKGKYLHIAPLAQNHPSRVR